MTTNPQHFDSRLLIFEKWDAFWPFLIHGTNSGPTRLELKQFSMLRRSLPKMVIRVSKGKLA